MAKRQRKGNKRLSDKELQNLKWTVIWMMIIGAILMEYVLFWPAPWGLALRTGMFIAIIIGEVILGYCLRQILRNKV